MSLHSDAPFPLPFFVKKHSTGLVSMEIRHVDALLSSWEIEIVYRRPLATSTVVGGQGGNRLAMGLLFSEDMIKYKPLRSCGTSL
jgi:hypothetical protein